MDDIAASVQPIDDALNLQKELVTLLRHGAFVLKKWMTNVKPLLDLLGPEDCAMPLESWSFDSTEEPAAKILGLVWKPMADNFSYQVDSLHQPITKRSILSDISRLYDPMGFLSPITFFGKWLMQYLRQLGLKWDDQPPENVCHQWSRFRTELPLLADFNLSRNLLVDKAIDLQLHTFSDSSENGFAAVVYLQATQPNGGVYLSLLIAKSKAAPLKKLTLPMLELCGALLAAKLLYYVRSLLEGQYTISNVNIWIDSLVALRWIQSQPNRWKTYVANRLNQIQSLVAPSHFCYVPSALNPADCASRGLFPQELLTHPLWIYGPDWLKQSRENWPSLPELRQNYPESEPEASILTLLCDTSQELEKNSLIGRAISRVSSLFEIKRIVAWMLRYIDNLRSRVNRTTGPLTAEELSRALQICVKRVQWDEFSEDINRLQAGRHHSHRLRRLNPFLDSEGILRVGGQLRHSSINFERKHPKILPKSHPFTNLVIDYYHNSYMHAGPQNLHCIIQAQFWILAGRDAIRKRLAKCLTCFRTQPPPIQPMMGDLPAARLQTVKAFLVTGADYGGPFDITMGRLRKARILKAYICLFVCFSTRAVHVELVSDLTTEAFLGAFRRFLARRGTVKKVYSDCGMNFVGAKRKLAEWKQVITSDAYSQTVSQNLADKGITWHLNPPSSPNFGLIWEAGIKSVENLLARVMGNQILTYEEFYTVLVQVEAVLNSRPLTPMSSDPNDLEALTPDHFLLLEPPVTVIEPDSPIGNSTCLRQWKLVKQIYRSFWNQWHKNYLCTLQQRHQWTKGCPNKKEGTLVLIREDNIPPLQWQLGRVTRTFPGPDGVVRVAEVKTARGIFTRAMVKLSPLPIE